MLRKTANICFYIQKKYFSYRSRIKFVSSNFPQKNMVGTSKTTMLMSYLRVFRYSVINQLHIITEIVLTPYYNRTTFLARSNIADTCRSHPQNYFNMAKLQMYQKTARDRTSREKRLTCLDRKTKYFDFSCYYFKVTC